jgi:hypothetical protein
MFIHPIISFNKIIFVITLTLGSQPRQGLARVWAKREARSVRECEKVNLHTLKSAPTLGVEVSMDF